MPEKTSQPSDEFDGALGEALEAADDEGHFTPGFFHPNAKYQNAKYQET
jgi:hypothetical protein